MHRNAHIRPAIDRVSRVHFDPELSLELPLSSRFVTGVSAFLGHANVTTTARYLNVKDDYLQELIERKPLALIR